MPAPNTVVAELADRARRLGVTDELVVGAQTAWTALEPLAAASMLALVARLGSSRAWLYQGKCARCSREPLRPAQQRCRAGFVPVMTAALAPFVAHAPTWHPTGEITDGSLRWQHETVTLDAYGHHGRSITPPAALDAYRTGRLLHVRACQPRFVTDTYGNYFTCVVHSIIRGGDVPAPGHPAHTDGWVLPEMTNTEVLTSPVAQVAFALLDDFDGDLVRAWQAADAVAGTTS